MNKDIQSLIEREAEKYADSKGIYNQHGEDLLKMGFNKGASFALSLFKWRKVEDELPEVGILVHVKVALIPSGRIYYGHAYFLEDYNDGFWSIYVAFRNKCKVVEWMPIPIY